MDESPVKGSKPEYHTPYDHEGHKIDPVIAIDLPKVKLEKSVTKEGDFCKLREWAIVGWKAFSVETGKPTVKKEAYQNGPAAF